MPWDSLCELVLYTRAVVKVDGKIWVWGKRKRVEDQTNKAQNQQMSCSSMQHMKTHFHKHNLRSFLSITDGTHGSAPLPSPAAGEETLGGRRGFTQSFRSALLTPAWHHCSRRGRSQPCSRRPSEWILLCFSSAGEPPWPRRQPIGWARESCRFSLSMFVSLPWRRAQSCGGPPSQGLRRPATWTAANKERGGRFQTSCAELNLSAPRDVWTRWADAGQVEMTYELSGLFYFVSSTSQSSS